MKKTVWWMIFLCGIGLFGVILYSGYLKVVPVPVAAPEKPPIPQPLQTAAPQIRFPVARHPDEKPLPALEVSDSTFRNAIADLLSDKSLIALFHLQDFVRRVVATVDNLPREKLALRLIPLKQAGGDLLVTGKEESLAIDTRNAARYALYFRLVDALDTDKMVALYMHFYPLFQQAYQELGYPQGYFNDRLVAVIDHLLDTPDIQGPIKLVHPKIFYLFADPGLESRSAGQKVLIRIGSDNAAKIKARLRDIRSAVTQEHSIATHPKKLR